MSTDKQWKQKWEKECQTSSCPGNLCRLQTGIGRWKQQVVMLHRQCTCDSLAGTWALPTHHTDHKLLSDTEIISLTYYCQVTAQRSNKRTLPQLPQVAMFHSLYATLLSNSLASTCHATPGHCWTVSAQVKAHVVLKCINGVLPHLHSVTVESNRPWST